MSESSGAQDASTLVLRISVPAGAEYQAIVKELAAKVATYLGDRDPDGQEAAAILEQVASTVSSAGAGEEVVFEFRQTDEALLIKARGAAGSADAQRPLPSQT